VSQNKGLTAIRRSGSAAIDRCSSRKNTNASIDETFERFAAFVPEARREGLRVRGYVSTFFGCPYEGAVDPRRAIAVVARLAEAGCDEVSIGDTIGVAVPTQVSELLGRLTENLPIDRVAVHFHDTRGTALANVLAALEQGVAIVDSAAGGTGGCPYAPGASGNLATEDLLYMLQGMGIETGVDLDRVAVHFHDTRGTALANVLAALEQGVAVVDSAAGGTGGCPYAPGASGNLATEDLLYMLQGMGIETGVELDAVAAASRALAAKLGRPLPSRYLQAGPPRRSAS